MVVCNGFRASPSPLATIAATVCRCGQAHAAIFTSCRPGSAKPVVDRPRWVLLEVGRAAAAPRPNRTRHAGEAPGAAMLGRACQRYQSMVSPSASLTVRIRWPSVVRAITRKRGSRKLAGSVMYA
jgi:hypothetical protein